MVLVSKSIYCQICLCDTEKFKVARDIASVEIFLHIQVIFLPVPHHCAMKTCKGLKVKVYALYYWQWKELNGHFYAPAALTAVKEKKLGVYQNRPGSEKISCFSRILNHGRPGRSQFLN
jgi:hypothetical protein